MRNCVDEGTLQAWFDGELAAREATDVETHLHECARCAESARVLEAEDSVVSSALAMEFAEAVPTERLRERINAAVTARPNSSAPVDRSWGTALRDLFASFRLPAYAAVAAAILLAAVLGILYLKRNQRSPVLVKEEPRQTAPVPPKPQNEQSPEQVATGPSGTPRRRPTNSRIKTEEQPPATSLVWQERQYERAIARLNEAIKSQPPMRPSLQVEYEYNLAVINETIAATRNVARKNPKDPQAAQFVLTAYQNKVDLMNQIADARVLER